MTPGEFNVYVQGQMQEQREKQELTKANMYALAVMIRAAVWEKRMPEYGKFFKKEAEKKSMSDDEMYRTVLALNSVLGGTVKNER